MNSLTIMNDNLHFNIEVEFNNNGKNLNEIFKENFLFYIREIKKENMEPIK